jgi:hypothetical protein
MPLKEECISLKKVSNQIIFTKDLKRQWVPWYSKGPIKI